MAVAVGGAVVAVAVNAPGLIFDAGAVAVAVAGTDVELGFDVACATVAVPLLAELCPDDIISVPEAEKPKATGVVKSATPTIIMTVLRSPTSLREFIATSSA